MKEVIDIRDHKWMFAAGSNNIRAELYFHLYDIGWRNGVETKVSYNGPFITYEFESIGENHVNA